jgi:serine/threonine protein kinase
VNTPAGRTRAAPQKRIGKYRVTGRIGRGGMGIVYRAYDEVLEREVAVKTLTAEATLDVESRRRFEIEAKAAARLQHPNIVTVYELGEDRGVPFIAMEILAGIDLEHLMRSGEAVLLQEKLDIMIQVCRGLAYAHEHRVIHRDIKPSNIRLLEDGTVKIMDFGIAKLAGTGVTKTGMMVGTVHYMSPEQIRGLPLDGRSDVFSVGVILFELLSGRRPFGAGTATDVLYRIVHEPPLPLEGDLGACAPEVRTAVAKALAKEVEARHAGAARLADELTRALSAHVGTAGTVAPEALETVNLSRRLLKEGRVEESLQRLREVAEKNPSSLEARRALRVASREKTRRERPVENAAEDFPELEVTYQVQVPSTDRAPETLLQPTVLQPPPGARSAPTGGRDLLRVGAAVLALAFVAGGILLTRRTQPRPAAPTPALTQPQPQAQSQGPAQAQPIAASVPVDATTAVPAASPAAVPAAADPELAGPQGRIAVVSSYPVDVFWKGKLVGKGPSPQVSLPVGRQLVTLVSSAYFLRASLPVNVRVEGPSGLEAPRLGRISIKARPDNCQVFIDGTFVDYPPILDRPVAVGTHTVAFKWPDGTRQEETAQVEGTSPVYVMGRKD